MPSASTYLNRIAYSGPIDPSAETLRQLHRAHLFHVPFENLDIHLPRPIVIDQLRFVHKVVEEKRGGFCYELNGAFAWLLGELGFKVTLLSARVARADGSFGLAFDHLTLRVDLDEPWLADVGFGDSFVDPLKLEPGFEQAQENGSFRVVQKHGVWTLERKGSSVAWKPEYTFTLAPHRLEDFAGMCHYHQTSPASDFTRKKICSLATPEGRLTLTGDKFIITKKGAKEEQSVENQDVWRTILKEKFGVVLPGK